LKDAVIPLAIQQAMLGGTGTNWVVKDIESGHSPQISQPEKLTDLIVEVAQRFETL